MGQGTGPAAHLGSRLHQPGLRRRQTCCSGDDDLISPAAICRRLQALQEALDHLPREGLRLARWRARQAPKKTGRLSPFRPGFAPGFHRHQPREIDAILSDCHYFANEAWYRADTS